MIKDLSAKLVAAAAEINQKSRAKFVEVQAALHEKMAGKQMKMPAQPAPKAEPAASSSTQKMTTKNVKEEIVAEAEGSIPTTPREKELAAKHGDKKRITYGDVMKARGVGMKKEEVEQQEEAMSHQAKTTMKHIPNPSPALKKAAKDIKPGVAGYRDRIDMLRAGGVKEEAEQTQEGWYDMMKSVNANKGTGKFDKKEIKPGVTQYTRKSSTFDDGPGKDADERKIDREKRKSVKEENMDTPGNSTHQCAIHVKSEQFGEGRTLTSQHAEPDAEGNIAWYDVMFAEGIKRVETKDVEVLVSESHMNHKKKKKAM
jgi:hypothetical protein